MFKKLMDRLGKSAPPPAATQREYQRRACDQCAVMLDGRLHPVVNWSFGGTLVTADERLYGIGQEVPVTLKFHLQDKVMDVAHAGRVIRKSPGRIAVKFEPIGRQIQSQFQKVIDDHLTRQFADSQTV